MLKVPPQSLPSQEAHAPQVCLVEFRISMSDLRVGIEIGYRFRSCISSPLTNSIYRHGLTSQCRSIRQKMQLKAKLHSPRRNATTPCEMVFTCRYPSIHVKCSSAVISIAGLPRTACDSRRDTTTSIEVVLARCNASIHVESAIAAVVVAGSPCTTSLSCGDTLTRIEVVFAR